MNENNKNILKLVAVIWIVAGLVAILQKDTLPLACAMVTSIFFALSFQTRN